MKQKWQERFSGVGAPTRMSSLFLHELWESKRRHLAEWHPENLQMGCRQRVRCSPALLLDCKHLWVEIGSRNSDVPTLSRSCCNKHRHIIQSKFITWFENTILARRLRLIQSHACLRAKQRFWIPKFVKAHVVTKGSGIVFDFNFENITA